MQYKQASYSRKYTFDSRKIVRGFLFTKFCIASRSIQKKYKVKFVEFRIKNFDHSNNIDLDRNRNRRPPLKISIIVIQFANESLSILQLKA